MILRLTLWLYILCIVNCNSWTNVQFRVDEPESNPVANITLYLNSNNTSNVSETLRQVNDSLLVSDERFYMDNNETVMRSDEYDDYSEEEFADAARTWSQTSELFQDQEFNDSGSISNTQRILNNLHNYKKVPQNFLVNNAPIDKEDCYSPIHVKKMIRTVLLHVRATPSALDYLINELDTDINKASTASYDDVYDVDYILKKFTNSNENPHANMNHQQRCPAILESLIQQSPDLFSEIRKHPRCLEHILGCDRLPLNQINNKQSTLLNCCANIKCPSTINKIPYRPLTNEKLEPTPLIQLISPRPIEPQLEFKKPSSLPKNPIDYAPSQQPSKPEGQYNPEYPIQEPVEEFPEHVVFEPIASTPTPVQYERPVAPTHPKPPHYNDIKTFDLERPFYNKEVDIVKPYPTLTEQPISITSEYIKPSLFEESKPKHQVFEKPQDTYIDYFRPNHILPKKPKYMEPEVIYTSDPILINEFVEEPEIAAPIDQSQNLTPEYNELIFGKQKPEIMYIEQPKPFQPKDFNIIHIEQPKVPFLEESRPIVFTEPEPNSITHPQKLTPEYVKPIFIEEPEPIYVEEYNPIYTGKPIPIIPKKPLPFHTKEPTVIYPNEPILIKEPEPIYVQEPGLSTPEYLKPMFIEPSKPISIEPLKQIYIEECNPIYTERPKPKFCEEPEIMYVEQPKPFVPKYISYVDKPIHDLIEEPEPIFVTRPQKLAPEIKEYNIIYTERPMPILPKELMPFHIKEPEVIYPSEPISVQQPKILTPEYVEPIYIEQPKPIVINEPKSIYIEEYNPIYTERPKPIFFEEPEIMYVEQPKPFVPKYISYEEKPKHDLNEELEPIYVQEPKLSKSEYIKPIFIEPSEPIYTEEYNPIYAERPKPIFEQPEIMYIEQPKPFVPKESYIMNELPENIYIEQAKPILIKELGPISVKQPEYLAPEYVESIFTEEPEPIYIEEYNPIYTERPINILPKYTIPIHTKEPKVIYPNKPILIKEPEPIYVKEPEMSTPESFKPNFIEQTKPISIEPQQIYIEEYNPIYTERPKPIILEEPEIMYIEQPKPFVPIMNIERPENMYIEQPKPILIKELGPISIRKPEYLAPEYVKPIFIEEVAPIEQTKPISIEPQQIYIEEYNPIYTERPKSIILEEPEIMYIEQPKPFVPIMNIERPENMYIEQPKSILIKELGPISVQQPEYLAPEDVEPIFIEEVAPIYTERPRPTIAVEPEIMYIEQPKPYLPQHHIFTNQPEPVFVYQPEYMEPERPVPIIYEKPEIMYIEQPKPFVPKHFEFKHIDQPKAPYVEELKPILIEEPEPIYVTQPQQQVPESVEPIDIVEPFTVEEPILVEKIPREQPEVIYIEQPKPIVIKEPEAMSVKLSKQINNSEPPSNVHPIDNTYYIEPSIPKLITPLEPHHVTPNFNEASPTYAETPKPVDFEKPEIVYIEPPKPILTEGTKPTHTVLPAQPIYEPITIEVPETIPVEEPKPIQILEPELIQIEELKPIQIEEPNFIHSEKPKFIPVDEPKTIENPKNRDIAKLFYTQVFKPSYIETTNPPQIEQPNNIYDGNPKPIQMEPIYIGIPQPIYIEEPKAICNEPLQIRDPETIYIEEPTPIFVLEPDTIYSKPVYVEPCPSYHQKPCPIYIQKPETILIEKPKITKEKSSPVFTWLPAQFSMSPVIIPHKVDQHETEPQGRYVIGKKILELITENPKSHVVKITKILQENQDYFKPNLYNILHSLLYALQEGKLDPASLTDIYYYLLQPQNNNTWNSKKQQFVQYLLTPEKTGQIEISNIDIILNRIKQNEHSSETLELILPLLKLIKQGRVDRRVVDMVVTLLNLINQEKVLTPTKVETILSIIKPEENEHYPPKLDIIPLLAHSKRIPNLSHSSINIMLHLIQPNRKGIIDERNIDMVYNLLYPTEPNPLSTTDIQHILSFLKPTKEQHRNIERKRIEMIIFILKNRIHAPKLTNVMINLLHNNDIAYSIYVEIILYLNNRGLLNYKILEALIAILKKEITGQIHMHDINKVLLLLERHRNIHPAILNYVHYLLSQEKHVTQNMDRIPQNFKTLMYYLLNPASIANESGGKHHRPRISKWQTNINDGDQKNRKINLLGKIMETLPLVKHIGSPPKHIAQTFGNIELTYMIKSRMKSRHQSPSYVKYKFPMLKFLVTVQQLVTQNPKIATDPASLLLHMIPHGIITEVSSNLKGLNKQNILTLTFKSGHLIQAKVLDKRRMKLNDTLKLIENVNSNVSPVEILQQNKLFGNKYNLREPLMSSSVRSDDEEVHSTSSPNNSTLSEAETTSNSTEHYNVITRLESVQSDDLVKS